MNFELFKKHPYLSGGGAIAVFIVFYLIFKSRSNSGAATGASAAQLAALDKQQAQVSAAESAAQMQMQGQLASAQIKAGTDQAAINAAQTVQTQQSADALAAIKDTNAAKLQEEKDIVAAFTHQTDVSANIDESMIAAHTADVQAGLDYANTHTINGSQNRVSIVESAMGNIPGSVAAERGQTISSASGDSMISSIAGSASKALSALFA